MSEIPINNDKRIPVSLTPYEWAKLLSEMRYTLQITNRDNSSVIDLYEKIATQLGDKQVHVIHRDNPNPEFRPKLISPDYNAAKKTKKKNLFRQWWDEYTILRGANES